VVKGGSRLKRVAAPVHLLDFRSHDFPVSHRVSPLATKQSVRYVRRRQTQDFNSVSK